MEVERVAALRVAEIAGDLSHWAKSANVEH